MCTQAACTQAACTQVSVPQILLPSPGLRPCLRCLGRPLMCPGRWHRRARELKHKVEADVKARGNRWSIGSCCAFLHASLGFFECQEVSALVRPRDGRGGDAGELLNVAQLFQVAHTQAGRADKGESTGLVRSALMLLCQRLQALALARYVYHSSRALRADCDAAKGGCGAALGAGRPGC